MLTVATDGTPLVFRRAGIGRYTYELLLAFARAEPPVRQLLANYGFRIARLPRPLTAAELDRRIARNWYPAAAAHVALKPVRSLVVGRQLRAAGADVYFAPNFLGLFGRGFRTVLTVHDLVYLLHPELAHPQMRAALARHLPDHVRRADRVVTDAECTRRDLIRVFGLDPARVTAVPLAAPAGMGRVTDPAALAAVRAKYGLPERFVLTVGTVEPRKNLPVLFDAIDRLGDDRKLVVVGTRGWNADGIMARLADLTARGRAVHLGYVPDADLPAIYSQADALAFPSVYEGFGIPVLEAMACGVPVVSSDASSLPEVGGDAAAYFDPKSADELADKLGRVLADDELRAGMVARGLARAAGFSWDRTAAATLDVLADACGRR